MRRPWLFWLGMIAFVLVLLWLLSDVLLPFVAGCGIAYMLDPVVDRLEQWRVPRGLAAAMALVVFIFGVLALALLIFPVVQLEVVQFVQLAPKIVDFIRDEIQRGLELARAQLSPADLTKVQGMVGGATSSAAGLLAKLAQQLLTGGLAVVNLLSLVLVTPVVAFFLLRDWGKIVVRVDSWLPRAQADTIRAEVRRIDQTLAGFLHGQVTVGTILAVYYSAALTAAGIEFAVILGIIIGVLSFIPFVGALIGLVLAVGDTLTQFGAGGHLIAVVAIFAVGQFVESNFLTPHFVGGRVELHPVWVIFALLAFASLFGFVGVLLAVPAAAVIGVLVRFALRRYLASPYYDAERG